MGDTDEDGMTEHEAEVARLHRELLRLAGRLPADVLARARLVLAEGFTEPVAKALDAVAQLRAEPAYSFTHDPDAALVVPVTDLTSGPLTDPLDRAAVRSLSRIPQAIALWRSWRVPPQWAAQAVHPVRVYVAEMETDPHLLPGVSATVMRDLDRAGLADPQVETYSSAVEPPPYQVQARAASALVWAAGEFPAVRIARVFDRGGPGGPRFDDDHERVDGPERDRAVSYLAAGSPIMATTQRTTDIIEPSRGAVVPMGYRTDGRWVWTDTVAYYLSTHGLAPDAELFADIRAAGFVAPQPTIVGEHRALAALFEPRPAVGARTA